jgi:hypothetical protein
VTRYPAEPGPAATILFVVRPVAPPAFVWYTHVLPMATGNGIELALANVFDATPGRMPGWLPAAEPVLGPALLPGLVAPGLLPPGLLLPGLALEAWVPVPDTAPGDPFVLLVTWGVVPFGTEPLHPARTSPARAIPDRATAADPCLLM